MSRTLNNPFDHNYINSVNSINLNEVFEAADMNSSSEVGSTDSWANIVAGTSNYATINITSAGGANDYLLDTAFDGSSQILKITSKATTSSDITVELTTKSGTTMEISYIESLWDTNWGANEGCATNVTHPDEYTGCIRGEPTGTTGNCDTWTSNNPYNFQPRQCGGTWDTSTIQPERSETFNVPPGTSQTGNLNFTFLKIDSIEYEAAAATSGCTDPNAPNYDSAASIDDGSCDAYPTTKTTPTWNSIRNNNLLYFNFTGGDNLTWTNTSTNQVMVQNQTTSSITVTFTTKSGVVLDIEAIPDYYTDSTWISYSINPNASDSTKTQSITIPSKNSETGQPTTAYLKIVSLSSLYEYGCTDSAALNYDSAAERDAGNCIPNIPGCTDSSMFNYDSDATVDDGSCIPIVTGCMDSNAANYNENANTDSDDCQYPYVCPSVSDYDDYSTLPSMYNVYKANKNWMNPDGTGVFDTAGDEFTGFNLNNSSMTGDTISFSQVYGGTAVLKLQPCAEMTLVIEDWAGNQTTVTSTNPYTTYIYTGTFGGDNPRYFKLISVTGPPTMEGCTDPDATNYNNLATTDDGTCTYPAADTEPSAGSGSNILQKNLRSGKKKENDTSFKWIIGGIIVTAVAGYASTKIINSEN